MFKILSKHNDRIKQLEMQVDRLQKMQKVICHYLQLVQIKSTKQFEWEFDKFGLDNWTEFQKSLQLLSDLYQPVVNPDEDKQLTLKEVA